MTTSLASGSEFHYHGLLRALVDAFESRKDLDFESDYADAAIEVFRTMLEVRALEILRVTPAGETARYFVLAADSLALPESEPPADTEAVLETLDEVAL